MTDITQTYIPGDVWTLIGLYLGHEEAKKLKFVSQYFNNPALQNSLWQPYLNALHKINNTIPYILKPSDNAQKIFIDGFKKIQERQINETTALKTYHRDKKSAIYDIPNPTTLAHLDYIDSWLNKYNKEKILGYIGDTNAKTKKINANFQVSRIPEELKKDFPLYLFIELTNHEWETPLMAACRRNNLPYIKELVACGAKINHNNYSYSPLAVSIGHGHLHTVKFLIEECKATVYPRLGNSPLRLAMDHVYTYAYPKDKLDNAIAMLKYLLTVDVIKNDKDTGATLAKDSNRLLKDAQALKEQELVDILLEYPEVFKAQPYLDQIKTGIHSYLYQNDKNKKRTHEDDVNDDTQENNNNSNKKPKKQ